MANTKYPGKDIYFAMDDSAGSLQQITGLTSVDGLPGEMEHYDATAVGDAGRKHVAGLENVTVTVEGWYDTTATTGSAVLLSGAAALRSADTEISLVYGPYGNGSGAEKITAEAKLKTPMYPGSVGDLVKFRAEFLVQGAVTIGSFT